MLIVILQKTEDDDEDETPMKTPVVMTIISPDRTA